MENLKKLRNKNNISQAKLSATIGITQESLSGYEINRAYPSVPVLIELADCLNTSTDYLLGRINTNIPLTQLTLLSLNENENNILFHYKNLSNKNKLRLEGYLKALNEEKS